MEFSKQQNTVLDLSSGWHACLASAGSGKTEILTERVIRAIKNGVKESDILCLTFTNRAAKSMIDRLCEKNNCSENNVFIGNTHAFSLEIIEKFKLYPATYSLCDEKLADNIWEHSLSCVENEIHINAPPRYIDAVINSDSTVSGYKKEWFESSPAEDLIPLYKLLSNEMNLLKGTSFNDIPFKFELDDFLLLTKTLKDRDLHKRIEVESRKLYYLLKPIITDSFDISFIELTSKKVELLFDDARLFNYIPMNIILSFTLWVGRIYEEAKKSFHLYDFDDILIKSVEYAEDQYSWCQIDEVQDFSPIQWEIFKRNITKNAHVVLFGDINQSIYRFLGANIEVTVGNLGDSVLELSTNYRSPENLVDFFNKYMEIHFPNRYQKVISNRSDHEHALIHVHREFEIELESALYNHASKLVEAGNKVAFLASTNANIDEFSKYLDKQKINYFKVSKDDILNSAIAQDFIAFLNSIINPYDNLSWSRVFWNFSKLKSSKNNDILYKPQLNSLRIMALLSENNYNLSDFLYSDNVHDDYLSQYTDAMEKGSVYFDTETTGLDGEKDNIIQIAGVKSIDGDKVSEIDLYISSSRSVGDSVKIHKITDEFLNSHGRQAKDQIEKFLTYCEEYPLIAHNMPFDEKMTIYNIRRYAPELLDRFLKIKKFCTLDISRRFFPDFKSHKLEYLLEKFTLEGINSHNAIDDVRAGSNLASFLNKEVCASINGGHEILEKELNNFNRFHRNFYPLYKNINKIRFSGEKVTIGTIFDLYVDHVSQTSSHEINERLCQEFKRKISNWAQDKYKPDTLEPYLARILPDMRKIKEADLITDRDKLVISTVHRAKGLEFDYVVMPSVQDDKYPFFVITKLPDSVEKDLLLEEQSRLLYVAITRAKKQLVIGTYNINKYSYKSKPSRYINPLLELMKKH